MKKFSPQFFSLLILIFISLATSSCGDGRPRPDIVVIVVDALRSDHLGSYGYHRNTSPHFDAFARDALLFTDATAKCPWTSPSIASLFTGLYPSVHGTVEHYGNTANRLDGELNTLADRLRDKGYLTAGFVANSWLDPGLGFDRGFNHYDQINRQRKPRAAEVNAKVLAWLDQPREDPLFLYVHYMDVHGPYHAPDPYHQAFQSSSKRRLSLAERKALGYLGVDFSLDGNDLNYYLDRYDGEILYTDNHIGQLLAGLEDRGLLADAVVVVTSDHGEAFQEHGHWDHGNSVYEEEISIPLAIRFPPWVLEEFGDSLGAAATAPVELTDLAPTLLAIAGTRFAYEVNGRNLLVVEPTQLNNHVVRAEELATRFKGPAKLAWRAGNLKVLFDPVAGRVTALYDLAADPGEIVNLATDPGHGIGIAAFEAAILEHLAASVALANQLGVTGEPVPLDPALRKKLESLGYTR